MKANFLFGTDELDGLVTALEFLKDSAAGRKPSKFIWGGVHEHVLIKLNQGARSLREAEKKYE